MKKLFVVIIALLLSCGVAFAVVGPAKVSSNTVTVTSGTPKVVTFNTVISKILVLNEDTTDTVHVSFTGLGWQSDGTYLNPTNASASTVGAFKLSPGSSVAVDINTNKIGFWASSGSADMNYLATTDSGTQP